MRKEVKKVQKTIEIDVLFKLIDLAEERVLQGHGHGIPGGSFSDAEVSVWEHLCRMGRHCKNFYGEREDA